MAKTRGGMQRPVDGDHERRRPTASVRRKRAAASVVEDPPFEDVVVEDPPVQDAAVEDPPVQHAAVEDHLVEEPQTHHSDVPVTDDVDSEGFPGGPTDCAVLCAYADHVAVKVWSGEERPELKLASHGRKVTKFGKPAPEIEGLVAATGLSPLIRCSVETGDRGLLSAFVERWHAETSSFHLPVGELSITLDDVASLLHIPVTGVFHSYEHVDIGHAITLLVELLAVTVDEAEAETTQCHGAYVRLSWLRDVYFRLCDSRQWLLAARAYLLHLVGCTLFANKSATHIGIQFLEPFRDIDEAAGFAWGAGALVHMYENLSYASKHHGKHLAGYITILQCWIYEHFPTVGGGIAEESYEETQPRACRWKSGKALPLTTYRARIDRLRPDDICWTPYAEHRPIRDFEPISLFLGFIRWGPHVVRYLPDRVVRQFGQIQPIPELPSSEVPSPDDVDDRWDHYVDYLISTGDLVQYPSHCVPGYMQWFYRVSHPFMTPTRYSEARSHAPPGPTTDPAPPPTVDVHPRSPDAPPHASDGSLDEHMPAHAVSVCQRLAEGLQSFIDDGIVAEGSEAYSRTQQMLHLARSVRDYGLVYTRGGRARDAQRRRL